MTLNEDILWTILLKVILCGAVQFYDEYFLLFKLIICMKKIPL